MNSHPYSQLLRLLSDSCHGKVLCKAIVVHVIVPNYMPLIQPNNKMSHMEKPWRESMDNIDLYDALFRTHSFGDKL